MAGDEAKGLRVTFQVWAKIPTAIITEPIAEEKPIR